MPTPSTSRARALCAEHGIDLDAKLAEPRTRRGGPPGLSAADVFDRLRKAQEVARRHGVTVPDVDAKLADPDLYEDARKGELETWNRK